MTKSKIIRSILLTLTALLLLSCDERKQKVLERFTIEYDEEVRLHDGKMIWVHITGFYIENSSGEGYSTYTTEISWDSGFKDVGSVSVFFDDEISVIDKYNDKWYVMGDGFFSMIGLPDYPHSVNCKEVGIVLDANTCITALTSEGEFLEPQPLDIYKEFYEINKTNIFDPRKLDSWSTKPTQFAKNNKLTWHEKLELEKLGRKDLPMLGEEALARREIIHYRANFYRLERPFT